MMLRRDVHLPVGTDKVWTALTEPGRIEEWFGSSVEWDLRPGGRAAFHGSDGAREGRIDDVEPGRRLTFLWWPADDDSDVSEVTYRLDGEEDGTRLRVTERRVDAAPVSPSETATSDATSVAGTPEGDAPIASVASHAGNLRWGPADEAQLTVWAATQMVAVA